MYQQPCNQERPEQYMPAEQIIQDMRTQQVRQEIRNQNPDINIQAGEGVMRGKDHPLVIDLTNTSRGRGRGRGRGQP